MSIYYALSLVLCANAIAAGHVQQPFTQHQTIKVPIELGVMSRCPDAIACEAVFDQVRLKVGDKMDLSLVYVAHINETEPDFGVTCMHGPGECAGNVQQLCVTRYSRRWWDFVQCQNKHGRFQIGLPSVAVECGNSIDIDWESSREGRCAGKGGEGVGLLQESVKRGNSLQIEKSCTVLINQKKVCIRDGTWQDCERGHGVDDFVKQINEEFKRLNFERPT